MIYKVPKVVMTSLGQQNLIKRWTCPSARITTGVLVGWSRDGRYMRIRRDKHKAVDTYHPSFWTIL